MTIGEYKKQAGQTLSSTDIGTAELDVLVLLEDLLNTNRAQLLAHPELEVSSEQLKVLNSQIERRKNHEPLAYIRGKTEFYGREFIVNNSVLEPRPESETMIIMLHDLVNSEQRTVDSGLVVVDIGTGSGALAITAKLEFPDAEVTATDIDENCLKIARQNTKKHCADITLIQGNLLNPVLTLQKTHGRDKFEGVLLANLPYVPDDFHINLAATHEPKIAIFGGPDGLDLYRKLFDQTDKLEQKPNYILTESLPTQHQKLQQIAKQHDYKLESVEDFIQLFSLQGQLRA